MLSCWNPARCGAICRCEGIGECARGILARALGTTRGRGVEKRERRLGGDSRAFAGDPPTLLLISDD
jgi:hypothetical protein